MASWCALAAYFLACSDVAAVSARNFGEHGIFYLFKSRSDLGKRLREVTILDCELGHLALDLDVLMAGDLVLYRGNEQCELSLARLFDPASLFNSAVRKKIHGCLT